MNQKENSQIVRKYALSLLSEDAQQIPQSNGGSILNPQNAALTADEIPVVLNALKSYKATFQRSGRWPANGDSIISKLSDFIGNQLTPPRITIPTAQ